MDSIKLVITLVCTLITTSAFAVPKPGAFRAGEVLTGSVQIASCYNPKVIKETATTFTIMSTDGGGYSGKYDQAFLQFISEIAPGELDKFKNSFETGVANEGYIKAVTVGGHKAIGGQYQLTSKPWGMNQVNKLIQVEDCNNSDYIITIYATG